MSEEGKLTRGNCFFYTAQSGHPTFLLLTHPLTHSDDSFSSLSGAPSSPIPRCIERWLGLEGRGLGYTGAVAVLRRQSKRSGVD